jgi:hypothetical protein
MTMETDKLTAIVRYRARADNWAKSTTNASGSAFTASSNDIYHEVWWKAADAFSVGFGKFQGQAWSQPVSGVYLVKNPIGDGVYWMNWTGIAGIDLEFNAGVVQVGLAISSQCKPSCNQGVATSATSPSGIDGGTGGTGGTSKVAQNSGSSMVPHLTGKFGDIAIRAQLPQTSGTYGCGSLLAGDCKKATDQVTVTGAGYQFGVSWAGMPGVLVALDVSSFTEAKTKVEPQDRVRAGTGLTVNFAGVTFHSFSLKDSTYAKAVGSVGGETTTSEMTLRYTIPMGSGAIVPEYRTQTTDDKAGAAKDKTGKPIALTNSGFRLIGNVNY